MAVLGKDAIRRLTKYELVDAPELGGQIRLRSLSASAMIDLVDQHNVDPATTNKGMIRLGVTLLAMCWVDEQGEPVVAPEESDSIMELPMGLLNRLCEAVYALNGLDDSKKNLLTPPIGALGSS